MRHLYMERVMGIEPTRPAWKAGILPLNYTRIFYRALKNALISYHKEVGLSIAKLNFFIFFATLLLKGILYDKIMSDKL